VVVAIDDERDILNYYESALAGASTRIETCEDPRMGLEVVSVLKPDLVFLDLVMPGGDGMETLRAIRRMDPEAQVVMATGQYSIETAVEAIREGAADYICKPVPLEKIRAIVKQARERARRREQAKELEKKQVEVFRLEGLIGRSPKMLEMFDLIQRVAPHFRTALVLGETGTGKELVARALHNLSPRKSQRFAICNCAAVVESLMESQLFGHVKGAFTGAHQDQAGLFEWANGGTVFLDEIGELSPQMQSKLLRVLENSEVQKLGAPQPRQVDVHVIAATSRDLRAKVQTGEFRADLWYRLNMVEIQLPPLRERKEDLPLLWRHFVDEFSKLYQKEIREITRGAQNLLMEHAWPGNVRELQNVIGRACLLTRNPYIGPQDLPAFPRPKPSEEITAIGTLQDTEKETLVRALAAERNKSRVAGQLGISRATLYRLMAKYGLDRNNPS
jgi:DNA-binding NtrC family response regulator